MIQLNVIQVVFCKRMLLIVGCRFHDKLIHQSTKTKFSVEK